ncbi:DUF3710 domain-containing protein [Streptomyces sp. NPDC057910]|uniref:DUF3710 domain-containing protein n=1 Tax=Streptomyces sp. NPDC057910 TaxID=3346278 RepID=UPI0036EECBC2
MSNDPGAVGVLSAEPVTTTRRSTASLQLTARSAAAVLGHDGPGWLLRGVVTGAGAAPESTDEWAYQLFASSVVVPSFSLREDGVAIALSIPDEFHGQRRGVE